MTAGSAGDPRLWVVDPSLEVAEDEGVARIADGWSGPVRVLRPALSPGDGPGPGDGWACDGIVVMGSAASVADDRPWLRELAGWLRPVVDGRRSIPLLGICFGHQLLAHLAGAPVGWLDPVSRTKRVAVERSRLRGGRLIDGADSLHAVVSHREIVQRAPAGFDVVGRRPGVDVDVLEHRTRPLFAVQFHPEAGAEFAGRVGLGAGAIDARVERDSRRLLGAFRRVVRDEHAAGRTGGTDDTPRQKKRAGAMPARRRTDD